MKNFIVLAIVFFALFFLQEYCDTPDKGWERLWFATHAFMALFGTALVAVPIIAYEWL